MDGLTGEGRKPAEGTDLRESQSTVGIVDFHNPVGPSYYRKASLDVQRSAMEETKGEPTKVAKRTFTRRRKQDREESPNQTSNCEDVIALKKQISQLEAENKQLRKQIAALTNSVSRPVQSDRDPVREQQHNFFKYSNLRRY